MSQIEGILFYGTLILYGAAAGGSLFAFASGKEQAEKATVGLFAAGFVLHTASLAVRGVAAGRFPLSNQFEFASAFSWGIALAFLALRLRYRGKKQVPGVFVLPAAFLVLGYAAMQSREIKALVPALQSSWLTFHVFTAVLAYGAFAAAFGMGILYLGYERVPLPSRSRLPSREQLEGRMYRVILLGFLFLTLVISTGAVWAKQAWGYYWSWDPKETWSFVTWILYALYLHVRRTRKWSGKKAAVFAVIGFLCVIFTFVGVNLWMPGLHSYA